jgi:hypothetical protein
LHLGCRQGPDPPRGSHGGFTACRLCTAGSAGPGPLGRALTGWLNRMRCSGSRGFQVVALALVSDSDGRQWQTTHSRALRPTPHPRPAPRAHSRIVKAARRASEPGDVLVEPVARGICMQAKLCNCAQAEDVVRLVPRGLDRTVKQMSLRPPAMHADEWFASVVDAK